MLTKKKLRRWLNIAALVLVGATLLAGWLLTNLSTGEKLAGTAAILAALRATIPSLKKDAEGAIDKSDLPEDEPAQEPTK